MPNKLLEEKLQALAENELVLDTIHWVFNQRIEQEKPNIEKDDDNFLLGEKYRAYEKAKNILEKVITDIQSYKDNKLKTNSFNKSK